LLNALLELDEAPEIRGLAVCIHPPVLGPLASRITCRHLPIPARAMYMIWNGLRFPAVETLLGGMDVYHATNYFLPPSRRARRILSIYDLAFLVQPEWSSPKIVGPFSRSVRRFAHEADLLLAASESTRNDIVKLLDVPEDKVRVIYGAANPSLKPVPRDEAQRVVAERFGIRDPYVLFAGTIEPRKNVLGLIRAFRALTKSLPHQLVLAGTVGWNAESTLSAIRDPGLAGKVVLTGFVSFDELSALYSAADVFVFPSFYEGFGLPVLEAMTCGCPVIASNASSLPEVGGDAAMYFDPSDVEGISDAIARVVSDADLRSSMIAAGHDQANRFSWRSCAEATLSAYRELAQ
jgi:glycosyltransferase involved in cell wall biosynthesis